MFKFRGFTKSEFIEGDLVKREGYWIYKDNKAYSIIPESLAVTYTGLTDKSGNQIYASFEVGGKMSKGGDVVELIYVDTKMQAIVKFSNGCFELKSKGTIWGLLKRAYELNFPIEIIGKQWEQEND